MKPRRLTRRDLALFAAPCLGLAGIGLPLTVYLPTFYSAELGLDLSAVGVAFMLVRLIDIGLDPILGVAMDHTRLPFGRFKAWLMAGIPVMMAGSALLFFGRHGVGSAYLATGLALAYAGWSICVIAQTSWGALLSSDYNERSRIYGWWQMFNLIGLLLILLLPIAANRIAPGAATGVRVMGLWILFALPLSAALAVRFLPEPPPTDGASRAGLAEWLALFRSAAVRRLLIVDVLIGLAFGVTGALFLFYFTKAKGFSLAFADVGLLFYFIGGIIGGPFWTALSRRTNKHTALALANVAAALGLLALYVTPDGNEPLALLSIAIGGLPYAAANQISRAMMADAADEERLVSGADHTGLLYALLTGTAKIGAALAVGVTFVGLDKLAGFDAASNHNGPAALMGLRLFFLALPAVLFALAALALIRYPLTPKRHDEVRRALDSQT
jgi:Na+/melibiose symporter-like transporter